MGHLEFLGFWKRFKSDLEPYMSIFPRSFVCRTGKTGDWYSCILSSSPRWVHRTMTSREFFFSGVSSPAKIYSQCRHLANYVGLKCPCLNIMAWNMRYLSSLSISQVFDSFTFLMFTACGRSGWRLFHVVAFAIQEMLAPLSLCYLSYGASVSSSDYSICDEYKTPWAILAAKSAVYRTWYKMLTIDLFFSCLSCCTYCNAVDIILSSTSEREQVNGIIRRCLEENILGGSHLMPNTIDASKVCLSLIWGYWRQVCWS